MSIHAIYSNSSTLPYIGFDEPGYTMLDYIDTSGSQYLDTGFPFTSGTLDVVLTVDFSEITSERDVISNITVDSGFGVGVYLKNNKPYAFTYVISGDNALVELPASSGTFTLYAQITDTTHSISLDGVNWDSTTHTTGKAYKNDVLLLGGTVYHTNKHYLNGDKIIRIQIYHNGVLIRDYVPSQNTSNDNIGLFDMVNENLIQNEGTGSDFTPGDVVVEGQTKSKPNALKSKVDQIDIDLADCEEGWNSKYTRVEYLTQNGTSARIDTGIQFKDIGYMDLDFQYNVANFTCVCGGATGSSNNYVCWYSNQLHEGRGGNVIDSGNDRIIGHRYRLISKQGTNASIAYRDGEFLKNYTSQLFSNSTAIMGLFAFGGGGYSGGTQRIYHAEFRTSEDGKVLGKFIPCIRKSDSKVGMYDIVTKQFFGGTGNTFYSGGKESHYDYQVYHPHVVKNVEQIDIDLADRDGEWMSKYTRLEYINNPSGAYIDIGYYPCQDTCIEVDCQYNSQGSALQWIFGSRDDYNKNIFALSPNNSISQMIYGYNTSIGNYSTPNVPCDTDRHIYKLDCGKCYYDGVLQTTYSKQTFRCETTMALFSCHSPRHGGYYTNANAKIYRFRIWEYGELKYDFIPTLRKSDMKAGLYDVIHGEFYTSSNGYDFTPSPKEYHYDYQQY